MAGDLARTRTPSARVLLLLTGLALLLAACGGSGDSDGVTQEEYHEEAQAFLDDQERYADEVASCAAEQGFEANILWDFGVGPPVGLSGSQVDQYWEVIEECSDRVYPEVREPTTEEVERHYDLLLAAAECLEEAGYSVPEPSSREAFVSSYQAGDLPEEPPWSPYSHVSQTAQFQEAATACPQPGSY